MDKPQANDTAHIREITNNTLEIYLAWGAGKAIKCQVREFVPRENRLPFNDLSEGYEDLRAPSTPLSLKDPLCDKQDETIVEYFEDFLETDYKAFVEQCYDEQSVKRQVLLHIYAYYREVKTKSAAEGSEGMGKAELVFKSSLKVTVLQYIMTNSLFLTKASLKEMASRLPNWSPPNPPDGDQVCPHLLNHQMKRIFAPLLIAELKEILGFLLDDPKDCNEVSSRWSSEFICLFALSMVTESMNRSMLQKEKIQQGTKEIRRFILAESEAMDEQLFLLIYRFSRKYSDLRYGMQESTDRSVHKLAKNVLSIVPSRGTWSLIFQGVVSLVSSPDCISIDPPCPVAKFLLTVKPLLQILAT
jgi:hypothetical protein